MRSRVVRVKKIRTPMFDPLGDFSRGAEIPIPCRPDRGHRETDGTCPTEQRRIRGRDDNWFVTCVSLGSRQEVDLALTAPPGLPMSMCSIRRDIGTKLRWGSKGATRNIGSSTPCNQYRTKSSL
jgi:hypothetical protein